jgi:hypothetical protein
MVTSGVPSAASAAKAPRRSSSAATESALGQAALVGRTVAATAESKVASAPNMPGTIVDFVPGCERSHPSQETGCLVVVNFLPTSSQRNAAKWGQEPRRRLC